ncbi:hypothetical protein ACMZOO_05020 [Catenovulum sp. SX2]|uniref:hypothetical protein n=1 Tax=Catenovulum sp. SX2 TaxID=3398614 RepID=UPI003F83971A
MAKLKSLFLFVPIWLILNLIGCQSDSEVGLTEEDPIETCTGFFAPGINVFVYDSLDESIIIENATVLVISENETDSVAEYAQFIPEDDGLSNSLTGAYYTTLSLNASKFLINLEVTADGYDSFVTKNIEFKLNAGCGADNGVLYSVYLCPESSNCL